MIFPRSLEDLRWIAQAIRETRVPFFIMGAGSNLLASDQGFEGVIIRSTRLNLEIGALPGSPDRIRTGASVAVSSLLRRAAQEGWGGLEFLAGVPGSVGGVVCMNAGTHLGETRDRLVAAEIFSLEGDDSLSRIERTDLRFEYRRNFFLTPASIVFCAEWEVRPAHPDQVKANIDQTLARRKATQPVDSPSCGSVFKNPRDSGLSAWQVVDRLGLRGHRIGDAQVSEKHSNFIINLGNARAADVHAVIELIRSRAQAELSICLEPEVMYLGRFGKALGRKE